jgi:hypothetical protein
MSFSFIASGRNPTRPGGEDCSYDTNSIKSIYPVEQRLAMDKFRFSILILFTLILLTFHPSMVQKLIYAYNGNPSGVSQWIRPGQAPDGLTDQEWTRIQARLPDPFSETDILHASDAQEDDRFGYSVALDGDTLVVGAYQEDGGPGDPLSASGAAYVFERDLGGPGNWGEAKVLHASDAQSSDYFGYSVYLDGDALVVGAYKEDGGPGDPLPASGAAYVFERDLGGSGNWGEAAILHASDAQAEDGFGLSVALNGDTLVVGAAYEDGGPGDPFQFAGAAYVFERDLGGLGSWGEAAILHASDGQNEAYFGWSVTLSGDTLMVGATGYSGGSGNPLPASGAVYAFERDLGGPDNWGEAAILHASDAQSNDQFGYAVALDGDTLVVGAVYEDGGPGNPVSDSGTAYVFERDLGGPGNWGEAVILYASDAQEQDFFGTSVALNGDTLAVGAIFEDGGPGNPVFYAGAVYVFERDLGGSGNWGEAAILHASDAQASDFLGNSVALDGESLVVGAHREDGGPGDPLPDAGAAYVFERPEPLSIFLPIVLR